jgi:hypothetical protein
MKKQCIYSLLILALFVFFSTTAYGQESRVNACYKKKTGALRIVSDPSLCNLKKENPISWYTASAGGGGIKVYSATDEFLGILVDIDHFYIPSLGKLMSLSKRDMASDLYYKSDNCTGTPYLGPDVWIGSFIHTKDLHNGQYKFYYQSDTMELATFLSHQSWNGVNFECEALFEPIMPILSPIIEVTLPFAFPFVQPLKLQ